MRDGLILRLALDSDVQAIARLSRDRIEHGLGWSWTPARVLRSVYDKNTNVVVAHDRTAWLGFGMMKYRDEQAHLLLLAVRPQAARQGVGTALVRWLEQVALIAGLPQVQVEVRQANAPALAFYEQLGYGHAQPLPGYYSGREAGLRLTKSLFTVRVGGE